MNGKFISIEGIEGAGKSTQLAFIAEYLKQHGKKVVQTREPGGTALGEELRELLLTPREEGMSVDAELLLMFAARAEHIEQVINPALARGEWVISDRFVDATFAYQGGGRGVSTERIKQISDWTLNGLQTDMTFLFDLPVNLGQQRVVQRKGDIDRFEQEKTAFFQKIRNCYLARSEQEPKRIKVIDSSKSIDDIQSQLSLILTELIAQK
jgi:dTMP kinase